MLKEANSKSVMYNVSVILVTKKYGDKTTQSVGYTKVQEFHNEGDIWEEDGRKWTIKNGVKQKYY